MKSLSLIVLRPAILLIMSIGPLVTTAQEIPVNNPSFEGIPHQGGGDYDTGIRGWYDCGGLMFKNETPPDLHPIGAWQVKNRPSDGRTYLGMVVRDNETWESISQRLSVNIEEGKCYTFDLELSRSEKYVSRSHLTGEFANYIEPAILRIWGGTGICGKQELLGESVTVSNSEWRTYEFEFRPNRSVSYFTLESFYKVPSLFSYNGHLLIDNASMIKEIPCDEEVIPAEESVPVITEAPTRPRVPDKTAPAPVTEALVETDIVRADDPVESATKEEPEGKNVIEELKGTSFRKGQIIRVNTIYFDMDNDKFSPVSLDAIEQIYSFLKRNEQVVIEVGGHTNTFPSPRYCDDLSARRAKSVASQLAKMGISTKRLYYKGYGKRKPIVRNDKDDMEARKKNQRVEIKILKTNYSPTGD
jgi:Outer membrane protein and related peptidoglycan-associated (lipo)proteins